MANQDCVFCRIVARTLPATVVYEDEETLAFMDIHPVVKGHVLVIPKAHHELLTDVPHPLLHRVFETVQRILTAQRVGLSADGVNLFQANGAAAGQVVPHVHVHVIPRFHTDGHHWNWAAGSYASPEEAAELADRMRRALGVR